jgi:hypothetical protein
MIHNTIQRHKKTTQIQPQTKTKRDEHETKQNKTQHIHKDKGMIHKKTVPQKDSDGVVPVKRILSVDNTRC